MAQAEPWRLPAEPRQTAALRMTRTTLRE